MIGMRQRRLPRHIVLIVLGVIMIYPLLFQLAGAFKSNTEIFSSPGLVPHHPTLQAFHGWTDLGGASFYRYMWNSVALVIPTVVLTVLSSSVVAYGFARFRFPLHKLLFSIMISMLMLPNAVIIIPRYLIFRQLHWLNTYLPFYVPAALATYPFFIFMLVQFFRNIPREIDESAIIDGANSFTILVRMILPLSQAALFSACIFQFIWTWNDFLNALIYISSVSIFPVSLGLRTLIDLQSKIHWNSVLAMSFAAMLPSILIFAFAQRYFLEGVATSGLKG